MEEKKDKKEIVVQGKSPLERMTEALASGITPEGLEKMLEVQERWDRAESKKAYHVAMTQFKADPPDITKDKTVSYNNTSYKHASLHNATKTINEALSKHGLSASWQTAQEGGISVTCKITHIMGHSEQTTLTAEPDSSGSKNNIQALGSAITYLERYTLLALTGLSAADGDDDGNSSEDTELITDSEKSELVDMLTECGGDLVKFCQFFKVEEITQLPKARLNEAKIAINSRKKVKK